MAIAPASSTNLAFTTTDTPTINKPSSLAAGDLMVVGFYCPSASATTCTRTGWTAIDSYHDTNKDEYLFTLYKVADSSDAAASNFAFTLNASVTVGGIIYRVTGYTGTLAGFASSMTGNGTSHSFTGLTPSYVALLIMFESISINGTVSAQTVDSSSMTETQDFTGSSKQFGAAYYRWFKGGTASGNLSLTSSGSGFGTATVVSILEAPVRLTDTLTLTENVKYSIGALVQDTIALVESVVNTIARAWSNFAKSVTSWVNEDK